VESGVLRLGQIVTLRVAICEDLKAIVRWTQEDQAGLEFLRPLPTALVSQLAVRE
jgi:hypothetical protein